MSAYFKERCTNPVRLSSAVFALEIYSVFSSQRKGHPQNENRIQIPQFVGRISTRVDF